MEIKAARAPRVLDSPILPIHLTSIDLIAPISDNEKRLEVADHDHQIELSLETEARLAAVAQARGIAPEEYAGSLLREALAEPVRGSGRLTVEEFHAMLDELVQGSEKLPNLPTDRFTRESFYED